MIHDVELITIDELRDLWPKDESGALCARLLRRYAMSILVNGAEGASCTIERGAAEAGASKAHAAIFQHFVGLGTVFEKPKTQEPLIKPLNRYNPPKPTP